MFSKSRIIALVVMVGALAVLSAIATFSPYRVSLSIEQVNSAAMAESLNDIPSTATPAPPTATSEVPTATAVPPTVTAVPPTATSVLPTATPAPPTATPAQPITSEVPPTPVLPIRTTYDDPTPIVVSPPTTTAVPTSVPGLPNVVIKKQASVTTAQAGEAVVFVLAARNTGTETARDVVVMDVVPDAFTIVDLQSTKGDIVADGQTVTAYPSVLTPGEQVTITITTKVRADAEVGPHSNTVFITTSTPGDKPEDNTSTVTVKITPPSPTQVPPAPKKAITSTPSQMPNTADPDVPTILLMLGPWIMMAMFILMFGGFVRFGMLRTRFVTVNLAARSPRVQDAPLPASINDAPPSHVQGIDLDAAALIAAWRSGASVGTLAQQVSHQNPHADRIMVGLAVQQIIDDTLSQ